MSLERYLEALQSAALLGSDRQALPDAGGTPLAAVTQEGKEAQLLNALALAALYRLAGYVAPESAHPTLSPAPPPAGRTAKDIREAKGVVETLLGSYPTLLGEYARLHRASGLALPPGVTARLLEFGSHHRDARPDVAALVAERGVWLARHLGVTWLLPQDVPATAWEEGSLGERRLFLTQLRERDPATAREHLASVWKAENAEARLGLLGVLSTGLSPADEPLLESALGDRSKKVRAEAADLLSKLEGSALRDRMVARAHSYLHPAQSGGLKKMLGLSQGYEVTLPETCDTEMQRDGLEPGGAPHRMGEKAWWFVQVLSRVPPDTCGPVAAILKGVPKDWQGPVRHALTEATLRFADREAARALLEHPGKDHNPDTVALAELLPYHDLEALLLRELKESSQADLGNAQHRFYHVLVVLQDHPNWSPGLQERLIALLETLLKKASAGGATPYSQPGWALNSLTQVLVHGLSLANLPHLEGLLQESDAARSSHAHTSYRTFLETLHFRRRMATFFAAEADG